MYAHYLISSSSVIENLTPIGVKPSNEAQARPLTKLKTPEAQQKAWEMVVKTAPDAIRMRASRISGRTNVQPVKPTKSHTKPATRLQLKEVVKEIKKGTVSDDDEKTIGDALADNIKQAKVP